VEDEDKEEDEDELPALVVEVSPEKVGGS